MVAVHVLEVPAELPELGRASLELDALVQVLGVLAHDYQIDVGEPRWHTGEGATRPDTRKEVEFLPEGDVDRTEARSDRGRHGPLECNAGARD
jgi:hypothetical protein